MITHQPIIASKANKHLYITKNQENNKTNLSFNVLVGEERIKVLAQLAGGEISEQSIEFARSLVN